MDYSKINIFSAWLIILAISVVLIILIGGYTRISDSGLSITEWQPLSGIFFPITEQSWMLEFEKYKLIDEFKLINASMTLSEFKFIYFWEWFHRAFARLIGFVYLFPLIYLLFYKYINKKYYLSIFLIGALLALQATVGWYMVKSGLYGRVDVSQYRLALHLTIAFIILGIIVHTYIRVKIDQGEYRSLTGYQKNRKTVVSVFILIFFQIAYGAFVSGTDSGLLYNTWPLYNGTLLPEITFLNITVKYLFFENGDFIVFFHRTFAFILLIVVVYLNFLILNSSNSRKVKVILLYFDIFLILQIILGIVMTYLNIPWYIALMHQGNSIILYLISIIMITLSSKEIKSLN
tara:strand:+ start:199 stop:1242 length:1044 start_codon:yes stop_codon:yes gene_type:complete